jgi:hypothetical protein
MSGPVGVVRAMAAKLDCPARRVKSAAFRLLWPRVKLAGSKMMERDDAILNSKDVALILDMSPDTVNEFARKSILPGFKKGRQWRFRRRDITFFKRQLRAATAA